MLRERLVPIATGVTFVLRSDQPSHTGVISTVAAGNCTLASSASASLDIYAGLNVTTKVGPVGSTTVPGQVRLITAYSTGRVATISPNWTVNPTVNVTLVEVEPSLPSAFSSLTILSVDAAYAAAGPAFFYSQHAGGAVLTATRGFIPVNGVLTFEHAAGVGSKLDYLELRFVGAVGGVFSISWD